MIVKAALQGLMLGLALAISFGPAFFALLQTSSKNGFKSGFALAIGIFFSDVFCVMLAYLGVAQLFNNPQNKIYIGLIGGTILMTFGFFNVFQKKSPISDAEEKLELPKVNFMFQIIKGFILNLLNPFVIIFWMGWVGLVSSNSEYSHIHIIMFFTTALSTVFITDVLKAYSANKISSYLSPKILRMFNLLLGLILIISGGVLIYRVFY
jgi:threonine/homoserine/homoserine lactone efflux protein